MHRSTLKMLMIVIALVLAFLATEALAGPPRYGHGGHSNYRGHGHGYAGHGYGYGYGYRHSYYGGSPYYYHGGAWYRPYGARYVVVAPPIGIGIGLSWYAGSPYYYYGNTYYRYLPERREYVVTERPQDAPQAETTTDGSGELYAYPRNNQDEQQQSRDRDECHQWAVSKTGFDPSRTDVITTRRADFHRAEGACLDARGYSVK